MELTLNLSPLFTEYVLKLLQKHNICMVIDFLKSDKIKLSRITNLELKEINKIRCDILNQVGPIVDSEYESQQISTGIASFDDLLGGGLLTGNLYDICGLSASGKTQICNSIAINLAINHNYETLYIDAKKDFSGLRIYKILQSRNCKDDECGVIMERIRCESIYDVHEFLKILLGLPAYLAGRKQVKCLIVDSLPALWFPLLDGKENGVSHLYEATKLMRKIAYVYDMIILLVNIVTRWTESDGTTKESGNNNTKTTVALGKCWQTVPYQRLLMSRIDDREYNSQCTNQRIIKIIKGNRKGKTCIVNITNKGVV